MIREDLFFERSIKYGIKNQLYIYMILLIEYYSIFVESLISMNKVLSSSTKDNHLEGFLVYANYINPYYLFKAFIDCNNQPNLSSSIFNSCEVPNIYFLTTICVSFIFFFTFFVNGCYQEATEKQFDFGINEKNLFYKFSNSLNYLFVNYFEIYFKVFGMGFVFLIFNVIGSSLIKIYNTSLGSMKFTMGVYLILALIFLIYFLIFYYKNIDTINIMLQFNSKLSYHYDSLFSRSYNFFLFYLKILIALENNLIIFINSSNSYQLIFLNIFVVISIAFFIIFKMIDVVSGSLIFISNFKWNLLRLVFLIMNTIFLIVYGIFRQEMEEVLMFIITFIAMFFLSFYVTNCVEKLINKGLTKNKNLIYQVIFILNLKQFLNTQNLQREIEKVILLHKLNCKTTNLENVKKENIISNDKSEIDKECLICNHEEYTYNSFLSIYLSQIKHLVKNNIEHYNKTEMKYFILLKLIILEETQKEKVVKLIYKTKSALDTAIKNKDLLYWNLIIFNKYIRSLTPENIVKKFLIMKKYDETSIIIEKAINLVEEIILLFDKHIDKEVYAVAKKVNSYRKSIYNNVNMLNKMKFFYLEDYTLIMIKYLYENLYNSSLKEANVTEAIQDSEELLSMHFENDNMIKINYNFEYDTLNILKASKALINYRDKSLEQMFPKSFQKEGKEKFIQMVKDNESDRFMFEYIINKKINNPYVNYFQIDCGISLSMDFKELLIIGEYNIFIEDILLIEVDQFGDEYLYNFSKNINKLLLIPPCCLPSSKQITDFFNFNMIFKKFPSTKKRNRKSVEDDKENLVNFYRIDYANYFPYYFNIVNKIAMQNQKDIYSTTVSQQREELKMIDDVKELASRHSFINISLSKIKQIKNDKKTFNIYSVKKIDLNKISSKNNEISSCWGQIEQYYQNYSLNMNNTANSLHNANTTTSVISHARSYNEKLTNNETKNSKELNQITISTSILSFIFIVYCICLFYLSLVNEGKINDSFLIRNTFNDLKINFYDTFSSLISNFELYEYNSTQVTNTIETFFKKLENNHDVTVDLELLIKNEIMIKCDIFQKSINNFQEVILSSSFKEKVDLILSEPIDYYLISHISEDLTLSKSQQHFIESLKVYLNKAQIIFKDDRFSVFLNIISFKNEEADFGNIIYKDLSSVQIYAYEINLNYIDIYQNFEEIGKKLDNLHISNIDKIFLESFYLFFILMGLHVVLIILCCCIIRYINIIINRNTVIINELMVNSNVKYLRNKFAIFRNFNDMYKEDPNKLLDKFRGIKLNYVKQTENKNESLLQLGKDIVISENKLIFKFARYNINNMLLIKPILVIVTIMVVFYYAFNLIFYFVIQDSKYVLTFASEASQKNIQIYSTILNNLNLLEVMIFTNVSDEKLNKIINDNEDNGYLIQNNDWTLKQSFDIYSFNQISSHFGIMENFQSILCNCSYIFNNLNDTINYSLNRQKDFEGKDTTKSLISICNMYNVMKSDNIKYIIAELNFIVKDLLIKYELSGGDYKKMKSIYDDNSRFDMFILLTFIMRPIQKYINDNLNTISVLISENYYLSITTVYLSLNIIIDLIIFFVIQKKIANDVLDINDDLSAFINMIKK